MMRRAVVRIFHRVALVIVLACVVTACAPTSLMAQKPKDKPAMTPPCPTMDWPFLKAYTARFISDDGRVIDDEADSVTTSEGQSYALFFALVANDRALFERLLGWTERNLAAGDLTAWLPAWRWGRDGEGAWRTLDPNSAADSDLWIAYALLEAGRLWGEPDYTRKARAMLVQIVDREVADLPGLGPMLLPAPYGFAHDETSWRLNPSYLPLQLLRAFESHGVPGPWRALADNTLRMIRETTPHAMAADWVLYRAGAGFGPDPVKGAIGSHDAIRVYLWAGMLDTRDPHRDELVRRVSGLAESWKTNGAVPLRADVWEGRPVDMAATAGFFGVLLPGVVSQNGGADAAPLRERIEVFRRGDLYGDPAVYYDQNLLLFALGFAEGYFRIGPDGLLIPRWTTTCAVR